MKEQLIEYIKEVSTVTDEELEKIISYFNPLEVEKNELLVVPGQTTQQMYFICNGCLRIFFITEEGQEATRYLGFESNFVTALSSFVLNEPSLEFVQALEPTELLYISRKDFYHLLESIPNWGSFYRHYMEMAYVTNTKRLMSFLTQNATERYKHLLDTNPKIAQRLSNKIVSSYLNVSQETLSRVKSKT